ncbi:Phosphate ABC transporter, periplasmic phosphate-binding protein PstS (TC 3.A.1.7.1) [Halorubrum sp. DM2]|uniref:PstS family phosphate ABC transporter substrate-binding protein n=1 Tax=Halorubrum sp. DM2 TaxID=2527867 RepID=UPI0024B63A53|nr:PstS family phosphate ABC transporter substrate-binding protein [Halorubrum sp. DM2]VTT87273.1 Phosphate ABC transporter, periplasmic phosphate-binding protein PstS (TC 3.A.1.7.1) [Halorubrum sp. DM2]
MASSHDADTAGITRRKSLAALAGAGALGLAGCTSGGDGDDSGNLSGDIRISGSSTVYPVAQEVTRSFAEQNPDVSFNLTRDGSGGGFENVFIPGDSDLNNSSRPIQDEEIQRCRDNDIEPVEFFVAQDALTVVVNNEADFIDEISLEDLRTIWSPDTAPELWSDVNPDWPDEPFDLYGPASTSGTYDYFIEAVIGETEADQDIREDFEGTEEDDLIAQGVQGNQYAFGYLPFAYYTNNPDSVKALSLSEGGSDPVEPSLEGAQSGNYPLARPLFFYGHMGKIQEKNHLQEFLEYYINEAAEDYIAQDIGYVPSSQDMVDANLENLEAAIAGEYEFEPISTR